jgi:choline dehydrogenase-like flavoprotein
MARELVVNKDGKVEAVAYIDKATREEKRINARAFIVAASACESARLLLNSKSTLFPDGLANSSGMVGRNLMDTVGSDGGGYFPALERMPSTIMTALAACMYLPCGSSIVRTSSSADTTPSLAADVACRASATTMTYATSLKVTAPP